LIENNKFFELEIVLKIIEKAGDQKKLAFRISIFRSLTSYRILETINAKTVCGKQKDSETKRNEKKFGLWNFSFCSLTFFRKVFHESLFCTFKALLILRTF